MIRCYWDEQGWRRVDPKGLHSLVAMYLEQDVQGSQPTCRELLVLLDEVEHGRRAEWSGTGNAHTLTIQPGGVLIQNEWDDRLGEAHLSLDAFRECLKAWEAFISREPEE